MMSRIEHRYDKNDRNVYLRSDSGEASRGSAAPSRQKLPLLFAQATSAEEPGQVEPVQRGTEGPLGRGALPPAESLYARFGVVAVHRRSPHGAQTHCLEVVVDDRIRL